MRALLAILWSTVVFALTAAAAALPRPGADGGLETLGVAGSTVYYAPPVARRSGLQPVLFYLHGRGGDAAQSCRRWAPIVRERGWLVCPTAPHPYGNGRTWKNDWRTARHVVTSALAALRQRYGRRVQLYGNTLIGFSEGAYVAMNVGVREQRAFNRWLLLAADDRYWSDPGVKAFLERRRRVHRVYLITGEADGVFSGTLAFRDRLRRAGVPVRAAMPEDMGHQLMLEAKPSLYARALAWLEPD